MPDDLRDSVIVPIFKEKGHIQYCANYTGTKTTSHTMKIWERIIDRRLRRRHMHRLHEKSSSVVCRAEGQLMIPYLQ